MQSDYTISQFAIYKMTVEFLYLLFKVNLEYVPALCTFGALKMAKKRHRLRLPPLALSCHPLLPVTNINESCIVTQHTWMSHVTHMNESCHTYGWDMSHMWTSHVTHERVVSHAWMSHVTHMNTSRHVWQKHRGHFKRRKTQQQHISMGHVTHVNEALQQRHTSMCHVTQIHESCHAYQCVMSRLWMRLLMDIKEALQ